MLNSASFFLRSLLLTLLTCTLTVPAAAMETHVYTLAVIPSAPPVELHKQWVPFVERLSRDTGQEFRLKMYEKMAEFERDIWSGAPDFIFSSPFQTVVAHKEHGYAPLVRGGKNVAFGLFVRRDSPIRSIDDLNGKSISFVGNKNLCSIYIRHLLGQNRNVSSYTREYAGSTRNVIINVLLGKSDAGAVFMPELANESEDNRMQLRELLLTTGIAPHPLSAHPRIPRTLQETVKKTTLAMAASREGAELLNSLRLEAPVVANYERDYRPLEAIDIKALSNWGH
jgi:phosphonate transport system substrate-binding protein